MFYDISKPNAYHVWILCTDMRDIMKVKNRMENISAYFDEISYVILQL